MEKKRQMKAKKNKILSKSPVQDESWEIATGDE